MRFAGLHEVGQQNLEDGMMNATKDLVAEVFLLKIDYELANEKFTSFEEPVGKRLRDKNDISKVTMHFADGTSEKIELPWSDDSSEENAWQSNSIEIKKPLNKAFLKKISSNLVKNMQEFEQKDRFTNRKILTIYVEKEE